MKVLAYHAIFCTHGFWLPNDPRGSGSTEVRYGPLRKLGPATKVTTRRSVAGRPHDRQVRRAAKEEMKYPEVVFTGHQARSAVKGFGEMARKADYVIHACAILPQHVHMVIARHRYSIEQVVRLLRQAATQHLLEDGLHPFAHLRSEKGRLPSVWAQDFRKVFLYTPKGIRRRIKYVEENPVKEGLRPQKWWFVRPYEG